MYDVIKVPMRVIDYIEDIPNIYDSYQNGDIFSYDPDNGFHVKLLDYGFLKHLDKDECEYYCNMPYMVFAGKEYLKDEKLNVENVGVEALNNLAIFGQIKKVLKSKQKQFSQLAKEFAFNKFSDFKAKVKELCNIEISHHFNIVTKEEEDKIREALK